MDIVRGRDGDSEWERKEENGKGKKQWKGGRKNRKRLEKERERNVVLWITLHG